MGLTFIIVLTLFQGLTFLIFKSNACEDNPVTRALKEELSSYARTNGITAREEANFNLTIDQLWEDECSWDSGSSANVVAVICWFLAGVFMLGLGAPSGQDHGDGS